MSEQMPGRIWAERTNEYDNAWVDSESPGCQPYVRADIAERMAAELRDILEWAVVEKAPLREQEVESIRSALSAFRSATQDTETRHD